MCGLCIYISSTLSNATIEEVYLYWHDAVGLWLNSYPYTIQNPVSTIHLSYVRGRCQCWFFTVNCISGQFLRYLRDCKPHLLCKPWTGLNSPYSIGSLNLVLFTYIHLGRVTQY